MSIDAILDGLYSSTICTYITFAALSSSVLTSNILPLFVLKYPYFISFVKFSFKGLVSPYVSFQWNLVVLSLSFMIYFLTSDVVFPKVWLFFPKELWCIVVHISLVHHIENGAMIIMPNWEINLPLRFHGLQPPIEFLKSMHATLKKKQHRIFGDKIAF